MATTTFYVKHRPVRVGFLVRPNELGDLEKAAAICTLLWGGIRNAIIPVSSPTDENAGQLLKLFQIDVIHAIGESEEIKQFCERYQFLHSEMGSKDLFTEQWRSGKNKITYLDTLNAIEKYWEKEFKHADVDHESTCKLVRWNAYDPLKTMFAVLYGAYPTDLNLNDDFQNGFLQGLRGQEVLIEQNGPIYPPLARCLTPMLLTGIDLDGYPRQYLQLFATFAVRSYRCQEFTLVKDYPYATTI